MPDRETAAHHEAAHAVLAVVQPDARPLRELKIVEGHEGWFGQTEWLDRGDDWSLFNLEQLEAQGRVTAAGRYAHERFLGTCTKADSDDWSSADDDLLRTAAFHAMRRRYGARNRHAKEAINNDVSDAELERAYERDSMERSAWIRRMNDEAKVLVDKHWKAIEAVAERLLRVPREQVTVENGKTGETRTTGMHRLGGDQVESIVHSR